MRASRPLRYATHADARRSSTLPRISSVWDLSQPGSDRLPVLPRERLAQSRLDERCRGRDVASLNEMMHRVPRQSSRGEPFGDVPVQGRDGVGFRRSHQLVAEDLPKQGMEGEPGFAQPGYLAIELECAQALQIGARDRLATADRRESFQERHVEAIEERCPQQQLTLASGKPGQHFLAEVVAAADARGRSRLARGTEHPWQCPG